MEVGGGGQLVSLEEVLGREGHADGDEVGREGRPAPHRRP